MRLLVATQPPHVANSGGVEILERRLAAESPRGAWSLIETCPRAALLRPEAVRDLGPDTVVYTQAGGTLSRTWAEWARSVRSRGAVLVEHNIFAQPSRHRPAGGHRMACLSTDGVHRLVLRAAVSGVRLSPRTAVLPNPLVHDLPQREPSSPEPGLVRLLRIGRPDPRKWTDFELSLATRLARRHPDTTFALTLVGHPGTSDLQTQPNLRVNLHPYTANLTSLLSECDVLLHASRIGETFGNTLSEGWRAGKLICCALAPTWDCGPLDFLHAPHVVAAPEELLAAAEDGRLLPRLYATAPRWTGLELPDFLDRLHELASGNAADFGQPTPTMREAVSHLAGTARRLGVRPDRAVLSTLIRESVRQNRRLFIKQEEPL